MQRVPIQSITLHAVGAALAVVGVAIASLAIVQLTLHGQDIETAVHAALRVLLAYGVLLVAIGLLALAAIGVAAIVSMLIDAALMRRRPRGVR